MRLVQRLFQMAYRVRAACRPFRDTQASQEYRAFRWGGRLRQGAPEIVRGDFGRAALPGRVGGRAQPLHHPRVGGRLSRRLPVIR